jgi:hypothetical protein
MKFSPNVIELRQWHWSGRSSGIEAMHLKNLGIQIATRMLDLDGKQVTVVIGKPEKFPDGEDYYCPYQIVGTGDGQVRYAGGIDAVQALQLALQMIGVDLRTSQDARSGKLSWDAGSRGDLGFPVPNSVRDPAP